LVEQFAVIREQNAPFLFARTKESMSCYAMPTVFKKSAPSIT